MRQIPFILLMIIFYILLHQAGVSAAPEPETAPASPIGLVISAIEKINSASDYDSRVEVVKEALALIETQGYRHLLDILERDDDSLKSYFNGDQVNKSRIERIRATAAYLLSEIRIFENPAAIKLLLIRVFRDQDSSHPLRESAGAAITSLYGLEFFASDEFNTVFNAAFDTDKARLKALRFIKPELFLLTNIGSLNDEVAIRSANALLVRSESAEELIDDTSLFDLQRGVSLFDRYQLSIGEREAGFNILSTVRIALLKYADAIVVRILFSDQEIPEVTRGTALTVVAAIKGVDAIPVLRSLEGADVLRGAERFAIDNAYGLIVRKALARAASERERVELLSYLSPLLRRSPYVAYEFSKFIRTADSDLEESQDVAKIALLNHRDYFVSLLRNSEKPQLFRAFAAVALSAAGVFDEDIITNIMELYRASSNDKDVTVAAKEALEGIVRSLEHRANRAFLAGTKKRSAQLLLLIGDVPGINREAGVDGAKKGEKPGLCACLFESIRSCVGGKARARR